jgi:hypothetical protein
MTRKHSLTLTIYTGFALFSAVTPFSPSIVKRGAINSLRTVHRMSETQEGTSDTMEDLNPPKPEVRCPNCEKCDGSGRILGGIPLILPWWPIKPYRPCPNFIANGGQYSRIGQPLDEIAFGRGGPINEDDDF